MLTEKDIKQIKNHDLKIDQIVKQLEVFQRGIPPVEVITAATVGNGIEVIPVETEQHLLNFYEEHKTNLDIVKFVPASGAASRMFNFLHEFLRKFDPEEETLNNFIKEGGHFQLQKFFNSLKDFAFVNDVRKKIRATYPNYKANKMGARLKIFVQTMLEEKGLNYKNLPKGLIPFHKYKKYYTTAFEEQLYEAAYYAVANEDAYLHFTFSDEHVPYFKEEFEAVKKRVTKKTKSNFHISYSFQKKETDTIAVTENNIPFRDKKNNIVLRPSGHGALLDNLNDIDADIIFIKNIDNVVAENYVEPTIHYKKVLAGKLLWIQKKAFKYLHMLDSKDVSLEILEEIKSFLWNELNIKNISKDRLQLQYILNRPLRVCGVVKNTGAPGGGPFWVKDDYGNTTLQIVETSQINLSDSRQQHIVNEATHFNPVDLVCGIRDRHGKKYDLHKFSNPDAYFISNKTEGGKPLKTLELPGLWNGAMAKWNTALVEVPLQTFNPVKTVNDLLELEHRPNG
jgi:hypothetical protein